jgi:hypothetical protein
MSQDPNAWWSKVIGTDLTRGTIQSYRDSRLAWSQKSAKERWHVARNLAVALLFWLVVSSLLFFVFRLIGSGWRLGGVGGPRRRNRVPRLEQSSRRIGFALLVSSGAFCNGCDTIRQTEAPIPVVDGGRTFATGGP